MFRQDGTVLSSLSFQVQPPHRILRIEQTQGDSGRWRERADRPRTRGRGDRTLGTLGTSLIWNRQGRPHAGAGATGEKHSQKPKGRTGGGRVGRNDGSRTPGKLGPETLILTELKGTPTMAMVVSENGAGTFIPARWYQARAGGAPAVAACQRKPEGKQDSHQHQRKRKRPHCGIHGGRNGTADLEPAAMRQQCPPAPTGRQTERKPVKT